MTDSRVPPSVASSAELPPQLTPTADAPDGAVRMATAKSPSAVFGPAIRASWRGHLRIARVDHWVKNVFVLPGILAAVALSPGEVSANLAWRILLGLLAVGLVASSNYTINEILDAPFDRNHPDKRLRPVPSGMVHVPLGYAQWVGLGVLGLALSWGIGEPFFLSMLALWIMGIVYNVRPMRSKDVPYLDVLSEAVNNPLRMLAGWFLVSETRLPPATLLLSYWMVGCYFMAIKRYAEARQLTQHGALAAYRRSLAWFTPERLLVAITFYGSAAMLFFGAFIMRYRLEEILSFPLVALIMAQYLALAFRADGAAQNPEKLYREGSLMAAVIACAALMGVLLFLDLPGLHHILSPEFIGELGR
jgi:4-hydroxybenzoate polyprenyltransferase